MYNGRLSLKGRIDMARGKEDVLYSGEIRNIDKNLCNELRRQSCEGVHDWRREGVSRSQSRLFNFRWQCIDYVTKQAKLANYMDP
jgi:hypothetical protein